MTSEIALAPDGLTLSQLTGIRIRGLRSEQRLSQAELGQRMGMSRTAISDREGGIKQVNIDELPAFSAALGESIEYLLGLTNERSPRQQRVAVGGGSLFLVSERGSDMLRGCRDSNPRPSDPYPGPLLEPVVALAPVIDLGARRTLRASSVRSVSEASA